MRVCYLFAASALLATSCSMLNYESDFIDSPQADYSIKSKVNRLDSNRKDYALVKLFLFDKNHKQLDSLNTHASDVMAWAVGWANANNLVVYSGDVGTQAWAVNGGKFQPIAVTQTLQKQADTFYKKKFKE
ncbi:hypothetical protein [Hymenobacter cheonanensis]|uniref:hypothetical protein n=1 Tax=Hymenobacter sp. CA2-7 TaxID=3063993 RepID=UPI0027133FCA|nr:hypothetical protein [Hymenobacter sp. CA2-7]MDO7886409.1 hypothetical protein [Hymenobacter sp. CA2-7]